MNFTSRNGLIILSLCLFMAGHLCAATYYVDPVNGNINNDGSSANPWSTLEEVFTSGKIKMFDWATKPPVPGVTQLTHVVNPNGVVTGGDTLMLRTGDHGTVDRLQGNYNLDWITIMAEPGQQPVIRSFEIDCGSKWHLKDLVVSPDIASPYVQPVNLIGFVGHGWHGPAIDIIIEHCYAVSQEDSSNWSLNDWMGDIAPTGIRIAGIDCSIVHSHVKNVRMGIMFAGERLLVKGNRVENFSADGLRGGKCASVQILNNEVMNSYASTAAGDGNHDDGMQIYAGGAVMCEDILVSGNRFVSQTDPNQPFPNHFQGIWWTDDYVKDARIENNLIVTDHYNGITVDARDSSVSSNVQVINNTVLNPYVPSGPKQPGVAVGNVSHVVVRNNIANGYRLFDNLVEISDHNFIITALNIDATFVNPSVAVLDFHLLAGNASTIDAGSSTLAPSVDLEGTTRDATPDLGAYEYVPTVLNFNDYTIGQFAAGTQGWGGTTTIEDGGSTLTIEGNGWKYIAVDYDVTADTVIAFDFKSPLEGEIHGLGFADGLYLSAATVFQLHGTEWYGNGTYNNYSGTDWVHYTIPVGTYITGYMDYLMFMNDDDAANAGIGKFSNIQIYEDN